MIKYEVRVTESDMMTALGALKGVMLKKFVLTRKLFNEYPNMLLENVANDYVMRVCKVLDETCSDHTEKLLGLNSIISYERKNVKVLEEELEKRKRLVDDLGLDFSTPWPKADA